MNNKWIEQLDLHTLEASMDEQLLTEFSLRGEGRIGQLLPSRLSPGTRFVDTPPYWERICAEFRTLICTHDAKYEQVRQELDRAINLTKEPATKVIVALIAGAIGGQLGMLWGPLVGVVGVLLLIMVRLGKEAYCYAENPE
jgi:hypothetical protein